MEKNYIIKLTAAQMIALKVLGFDIEPQEQEPEQKAIKHSVLDVYEMARNIKYGRISNIIHIIAMDESRERDINWRDYAKDIDINDFDWSKLKKVWGYGKTADKQLNEILTQLNAQ